MGNNNPRELGHGLEAVEEAENSLETLRHMAVRVSRAPACTVEGGLREILEDFATESDAVLDAISRAGVPHELQRPFEEGVEDVWRTFRANLIESLKDCPRLSMT